MSGGALQYGMPAQSPYMGAPQQPAVQGSGAGMTNHGPAMGGMSPAGQGYGWNMPTSLPSNVQPQYPQLYGGQWNQLSQLMAGPSYTSGQPTGQPPQTMTGGQQGQTPNARPYMGGRGGMGLLR